MRKEGRREGRRRERGGRGRRGRNKRKTGKEQGKERRKGGIAYYWRKCWMRAAGWPQSQGLQFFAMQQRAQR